MSVAPRPAAVEVRQAARFREPVRAPFAGGEGLFPRGLHEADPAADRSLTEPPEVGFDHGADLRVTAGGLRIPHLHDRLSVRGYLDDPRHNSVGAGFDRCHWM